MKIKEIKIELFESYIFIFWDCQTKDVAKWVRKNLKGVSKKIPDYLDTANCLGVCLNDHSNLIIWLSKNPTKTKKGKELLVHEISHGSYKLMKHWNIEVDENSDEILAMLSGYIYKKFFE